MTHVVHLGEKFAARVSPEPTSGCWLWTGNIGDVGYGVLYLGRGVSERAHRVAWTLHRGPLPPGSYVLHRCDNRACVNPDHLFLGTHLDNVRDMIAKGRGRGAVEPGERHARAKLSNAQARECRARALAGEDARSLAAEYGIARGYVYSIKVRPERRDV